MKALVVSRNLIGDSCYIQPAVKKWQELHPDWQLDLLTHKNHITVLYYGMGIKWTNIYFDDCPETDASNYDSKFILGAGDAGVISDRKKVHIAEGYADMMGVKLDEPYVKTEFGTFRAIHPYFDPQTSLVGGDAPTEEDMDAFDYGIDLSHHLRGCVLWSPFSASCTSQEKDKNGVIIGKAPNKMLATEAWMDAITYMRSLGPLRLLGSKNELVPAMWKLTMEETGLLGLPLAETALLMRQAKLVVTVDNGMGHLAASQDANHVVFYPMCLGMHFIVPWGANFTVPVHMDPASMNSALVYHVLQRSLPKLERQRSLQNRRMDSGV